MITDYVKSKTVNFQALLRDRVKHNKFTLRLSSALTTVGDKFAKDDKGNVALIFGVGSLIIFTFAALAVDFSRYNLVRSDLLESMDSAGLAMAQYVELNPNISQGDLVAFGEAVFFENFQNAHLVDELNLSFQVSPTAIRPRVEGFMDAILLQQYDLGPVSFNFSSFDMMAGTTITRRGSGQVELALVLDVTGSMNNDINGNSTSATSTSNPPKLQLLKDSVEIMLQTLYGDAQQSSDVKVSVVPFNTQVNVGTDSDDFSENWLDLNAEAAYHGSRFIFAQQPTQVDVSFRARQENSNGSNSSFSQSSSANSTGIPLLIDPQQTVNHFDLYDSNTSLNWEGCVEARPFPLDELDTPPGISTTSGEIAALMNVPSGIDIASSAEDRVDDAFDDVPSFSLSSSEIGSVGSSRWVPVFQPDAPDCQNGVFDCYVFSNALEDNFNYSFNHRNYLTDAIFDRPNANGHNNSSYFQTSFVNDQPYVDNEGGQRNLIYTDFNRQFRFAVGPNNPGTTYWNSVRNAFLDIGADNRFREEYIARSAYVGLFNSETRTYFGKYDNGASLRIDPNNTNSTINATSDPNGDCPQPILPLTTDRSLVSDTVQDLTASGGTNSAYGAVWGWRTISPQPPYTQGVSYGNGAFQKAVVIMTDGVNSIAFRDTHFGSDLTAYGYAEEERMGSGVDSASEMVGEIDNKMLRICQRMKAEGVLVYTIIFGLDEADANTSSERNQIRRTEALYRACATTPELPYYHNAQSAVDLDDAFRGIAADLVNLHISQ